MNGNNYQLITDAASLRAAVEQLSGRDAIGFDTETTSLDPYEGRVRLVQLSDGAQSYVIDLDRFRNGIDIKHSEALAPLRTLLFAPRPVKVAHNAKFDAKWIMHDLGVEIGGLFDTLLGSQLISAGEQEDRHSLESVAARYLDETVDKSEQLSDWSGELSESQLSYAARDAELMLPLRERMITRLRADELIRCAQLEFECVLPVAGLELAGIYLDAERWREQMVIIERKRATLAEELQSMLSEGTAQGSLFANVRTDINIDSHTQLSAALKRLGVPVPDSTRNWKLQPLAAQYPVVEKLLEYRTVQKSLTSYGANILEDINPVTKRIHANFHQIGAPTGRFSCLAGDTLVNSSHGFKRMDELREGDLVQTSYRLRRVEKAWCTGTKKLYRVQLRDGRFIRATKEHLFLTGQGDTWKSLGELQTGDTVFVSFKAARYKTAKDDAPKINFPKTEVRARKSVRLPESLSTTLCTLMGLIVADGFLGRRHERSVLRRRLRGLPSVYDRVYLAFDWQDQELIDRIVRDSLELFGQPFVEIKSRSCRVFQLASTTVAHYLAELGLTGNAHTKTIPPIVMSAPPSYQAAFLKGLFEGDGFRGAHCIGLTSVNQHLLFQVQLMLSHLGIYSTVYQRHDESGFSGSTRYDLQIHQKTALARFMREVGFISSRKNKAFDHVSQPTDGIVTPFVVSGAQLYREAVASGVTEASRIGVRPFINFYKRNPIKDASVRKLIDKYGMLPSLKPVSDYLDRELRPVKIESITEDEVEKVYDISVEGVHEFIANGIVVHNCTKPNIQQVPHSIEYRRCFRAPEGRKLVISDYSQIELRILADFTGDQGFIDAFNSGADLHRVTAAQVFGVPLDQVSADQRSFAKRLNFGVVYGIGAQRFSMMTGLALSEAEDILRRYFSTYRALDTWLREAARQAIRERTAPRTVAGRLARFNFDPTDKQAASLAQRNGKNSPIQGCVRGETRILTAEHGYVKIEDVAGQNVTVWDGHDFVPAGVIASGPKRLVKLELWGGYYIECSPNHKCWTIDANGRGRWLKAEDLAPLKQIYVDISGPAPDWELPLELKIFEPRDLQLKHQPVAKPHNAKTLTLDAFPDRFAMGLWVGRLASDGSVSSLNTKRPGNVVLMVAEHEEVILPELEALTGTFGYFGKRTRITETQPGAFHSLTVGSISLTKQLLHYGIKERIPDFLWKSKSALRGYLRGMFDGDGTVNTDGPVLTFGKGPSHHLEWARQIQQALLLFGIRSRINCCQDRINVRVMKRDSPAFAKEVGFMNPVKQSKLEAVMPQSPASCSSTYGRAIRVKSVEITDEAVEMYDVINSASQRFAANGLITHNSSADILKRALRLLHDKLKNTSARIVNIVHDEIVVETEAEEAAEMAKVVEEAMCAAGEEYIKRVPVKVESEIADEWVK